MKHPSENHSEREPRWRRPADDPRGPDTVTFIPSTAGCGFVAVDSKPLPHPHARFNRWLYEPLLILTLPLVTMLSLLLARSEEHTSELQSQSNLVCRLLLE